MPRLHQQAQSDLVLAPTASQYQVLDAWAEGAFVNDLDQPAPPELLPDGLDRAASRRAQEPPSSRGSRRGAS